MDNNLDWKDFQEISITLYEEFPDIDPQWISFPDLHSKICNLDNFIGDPWDIVAQVAENPHWLEEFHAEFEEYLREREYIQ